MSPAYLAHGLTLSFVWFIGVNVVASLIVACVAAALLRRDAHDSPALWLALRLTPAVLSTLFVVAVFMPSYWKYEPREFVQGFDLSLTLIAIAAAAMIAAAGARAVVAALSVNRRAREWSA